MVEITSPEALETMKRARAGMLVTSPFFGETALKLDLKEDLMENVPEEQRTMWTDGKTLGYYPGYVLKESMDVLRFSNAHEVEHCILGHNLRRNGRDPLDWNIACDYVVNGHLAQSGYNVPKWVAYHDEKYYNMSAESIFDILKGKKQEEEQQKQEQQKEDKEEQKDEESDNEDTESSTEDNEDTPSDDSEDEEQGDTQADSEDPQEGKGGDAEGEGEGDQPGEGKGDCPGGCGEIRDYPGEDGGEATGDEIAAVEQEWQSAAAMAKIHAEGAGLMPGYMSKLVDEILAGKVDWQEVMQRFVAERAADDYSWEVPDARYAHTGFILPDLFSEKLPPVVVAIDTSGSTDSNLSEFAAECEAILALYDTTLIVIMADTEVRSVQEYTRADVPLQLDFKGGGGTRFSPTFKFINEMDVDPTCVIYLTDMDCYDFGPMPEWPVLWVQTEGPSYDYPFGELVRMNPRW